MAALGADHHELELSLEDSPVDLADLPSSFEAGFLRERAGFGLDFPIVLFLGRITMQKGPEYFLAAAKKVLAAFKAKYPKLHTIACASKTATPPINGRRDRPSPSSIASWAIGWQPAGSSSWTRRVLNRRLGGRCFGWRQRPGSRRRPWSLPCRPTSSTLEMPPGQIVGSRRRSSSGTWPGSPPS